MEHALIEMLVQNKPGVLDRIVGQIRREGWNIKRLAVDAVDGADDLSRMQFEVEGSHVRGEQIVRQVMELDCVIQAEAPALHISRARREAQGAPDVAQETAQARDIRICAKPQGVFRILTVNPGSTSTKMAVYDDETLVYSDTIRHTRAELDAFADILAQKEMRRERVCAMMASGGIAPDTLDAVAGRGGLLRPIESGTYRINAAMLKDLQSATAAIHASALGGVIACEIAQPLGIASYIVDPIVVDEMNPYAKLTGMPGIERRSVFHALNQKAIARRCAQHIGKPYESCRFVVAHLGGGVTIGAHRYGRVIDVNDALSGEGAFTPERSGGIPALPLIDMCFSGSYTKEELIESITKRGGIQAYLGTNSLLQVEQMIREGDTFAALVLDSMAYQLSKEIGAMVAALNGRADGIILTGGMAYSGRLTGEIRDYVDAIAPVYVFPGEDEMLALAQGVLRILRGEELAKEYEHV